MKTKIFIFVLMVFCLISFRQNTSSAQSVWSQQILSPPSGGVGYYSNIQFVNSVTGWSSGFSSNSPNTNYGVILKSTNGGNTWVWVDLGWSTQYDIGLFFLNENTGWTWTNTGLIKKTTDVGNTWTDQSFGGGSLYSITFVNDQTGYAAGYQTNNGVIRKTTNGGTNWTTVSTVTSFPLRKVKFINEMTGWVSGVNGANHYFGKTTNGGANWTQLLFEYTSDFFLINAQTGWVTIPGVSNSPAVIKKTTDGGSSWSSVSFPSAYNTTPNSIKFFDQNTGWCASNNGIFRTTNGGLNWISQNSTPNMYNLCFIGNDSVWASGMACILKTTNGSTLSVTQISSNVPNTFSLKQNYPNPFNPETKINFDIKNSGFASLKVFDMTGREVKSLVNENIAAGSYEINFNGSELNSGVYFYTLKTNEFTETKKMMLVK